MAHFSHTESEQRTDRLGNIEHKHGQYYCSIGRADCNALYDTTVEIYY